MNTTKEPLSDEEPECLAVQWQEYHEQRLAEKQLKREALPGWKEADDLLSAIGCRNADALLAVYGPDRIIAAWKALKGE